MRSWWVLAFAPLLPGQAPQEAGQESEPPRLRRVEIRTQDVFDDEEMEQNLFYRLANALHSTTKDHVVEREVWLRPGDRLHPDLLAELERNLRELRWFGAVSVTTAPHGDGTADLIVSTRDRFSLAANVSLSRTGGVEKTNFRLAETNLLGSGKAITLGGSREEDEYDTYLRYTDAQFLGSRHVFDVRAGNSDEGPFGNLEIVRPVRRLDDPLTYGAAFAFAEEQVDYYERGETTAEVPDERRSLRLFAASLEGPRELRSGLGLDLRASENDYEPATGPAAADVRVPGDTRQAEVGPYWTLDWRPRFDVVQGLDSLDYDEDLELGVSTRVRLAARLRAEDGQDTALQPLAEVGVTAACAPFEDAYLTFAASASGRTDEGRLAGWGYDTAVHAYWLGLPRQTLAGSFTFSGIGERQDLERQLTLGEDNGLRGYPARELTGTRMTRLNLEDRFDTGLEVLSVRIGAAAFFDAGWMHDPGLGYSLGEAYRGAGVGLRLGSSHLFGGRVLRLDVAWPLDELNGEDFGVSISFAVGQVFTFFGNADVLDRDF